MGTRFQPWLSICAVGLALASVSVPLSAQVTPVTLQWFETSWRTMEDRTADAFLAGYARIWTPPISKGQGGAYSVGYNVFDRFDLGSPASPTRYGTRAGFEAVIAEQDKAGIGTFIDLVLNHNGTDDQNTTGFPQAGGYPGFVLSWGGDGNGDFHARWDDCNADPINCRIAGLIDIAQEKNYVMVRQPVDASDSRNIPAGTTFNRPDPGNRQFYPDPSLPANSLGIHPFNAADPMAGEPTPENATGYLLRHIQWLIEVVGVDGFRLDAVKHMPAWFLRDFYDRVVWQRGPGGSTPYSFMEIYDGSWDAHAAYLCKSGQGNCNTSGGVSGNRDTLDFPLFFRLHEELNGTGLGSWENIIGASVDGAIDGNPNNGSCGVQFVSAHDDALSPPAADNLAYAYILMRTGSPVVYFRGGEFGNVSFPRDGRGDALGGQYGDTITRLLDVHNEYARGEYIERRDAGNWSFEDVLVFERSNACLVGLNDRADGGFDQRTVATGFAAGTRLHELTGNAQDSTVDPYDDIWDVVTVQAGGVATIRVPRSKNPNGVYHGRSYVVYGPINPAGELSLSPVASVIAADPVSKGNATRRLAPLEVVNADSFEVRLETVDPDPLDDGDDDHAMLKMDDGQDINGNGRIDVTEAGSVAYHYEDFLTQETPLRTGGVIINGTKKGLYRQVIDATRLSEGRHYLSVIAFRSRPSGTPPLFQTWRKVLIVDRRPPVMSLVSPPLNTRIPTQSIQVVLRCTDRTANSVHIFLDQPAGTDLVALAQAGQGSADRVDRDLFTRTLTSSSLPRGKHRIDVVAFEETGHAGVTTFTDIGTALGDFDNDGDVDMDDFGHIQACLSVTTIPQNDETCADARLDGDNDIDGADLSIFRACFSGAGVPATPTCGQ